MIKLQHKSCWLKICLIVTTAFSITSHAEQSKENPALAENPIVKTIEYAPNNIQLSEIANGFTAPLAGAIAPSNELIDFLFIADQIGLIWRVELSTGEKSIFIDIQDKLIPLGKSSPGGYDERGLLGFAFHPSYANNGLVYLYTSQKTDKPADFTTLTSNQKPDHQSVVIEITVDEKSRLAAKSTTTNERELLRIDQPQYNHNGGALVFDKRELLYISVGDGGKSDDQGTGHSKTGNGSDLSTPLGSILRINPLGNNAKNKQYGIPKDNPFLNQDNNLDEIYAYGFRNSWKISFDSQWQLFAADVGQNHIEEINKVDKGKHYGWPYREGSFWFDKNGSGRGLVSNKEPHNLPAIELTDPLFQYDHDEVISITGGYAYQGKNVNEFKGQYVFADFRGRVFIGELTNEKNKILRHLNLKPNLLIFSFAEDSHGELYIMGNANASTSGDSGKLLKFIPKGLQTNE